MRVWAGSFVFGSATAIALVLALLRHTDGDAVGAVAWLVTAAVLCGFGVWMDWS